ncbi:hypothetical protein ACWD01_36895 [Streptomyces sp. NPDC002835]
MAGHPGGPVTAIGIVQVGFGQPAAALSARVVADPGGLQVLDAAGAGQVVDVEGDPPQDGRDPGQPDRHGACVGEVGFGAEVDGRRVRLGLQVVEPLGALP